MEEVFVSLLFACLFGGLGIRYVGAPLVRYHQYIFLPCLEKRMIKGNT